jgi:sulfur-oxidizing protein SoxY
MKQMTRIEVTRRQVLATAGAAALVASAPAPATATQERMAAAIRKVVGEAKLTSGRVKLDIPPLVETGSTVPVSVRVESPMTAADHVRAIHIFNEKNPQPNIVSIKLGPRAGKAEVSVRARLSDTQDVIAVAEMSDGSFWSDKTSVIVTLGACMED